jgi:hypothetical protein
VLPVRVRTEPLHADLGIETEDAKLDRTSVAAPITLSFLETCRRSVINGTVQRGRNGSNEQGDDANNTPSRQNTST